MTHIKIQKTKKVYTKKLERECMINTKDDVSAYE